MYAFCEREHTSEHDVQKVETLLSFIFNAV
jgi:hypothetical protein